jgi:hypothetical protein
MDVHEPSNLLDAFDVVFMGLELSVVGYESHSLPPHKFVPAQFEHVITRVRHFTSIAQSV